MPILQLIIWLVIVGLIVWLVDQLPIDGKIKQIIKIVVIVLVILWLISLFLPGWTIGPRIGHPG